ncbi:MAG: DegV family protein [Ruminococcaceae bacterium]|nr:DegV family protein [Oscillospiraceae bacterium]
MNEYVIYTDSACDISPELLAEWKVPYSSLSFRFNDSEKEYSNDDMNTKAFYDKMREGGVAKTSAINADTFALAFEKLLNEGKDILYLGFSSGLSATYNSARIAAEQLKEKYPERKLITVDSLAASAGFGLLLYLTLKEKEKGASIEAAAKFAEKLRLKVCHWFTVDDLVYLKRGGRISPTAAFVGNMLGIKPVLHVDNEGHLINVSKVRGRRSSVSAMADKYGELALDPENGTVFISHGDCMADVELLKSMLKERYGAEVKIVSNVGTVIGAHSGPGTLALFFIGKER